MQSGDIKDSQITASSSRPADLPHYGRLHNGKYWCAKEKNKNEYIQIDFGQVSPISNLLYYEPSVYSEDITSRSLYQESLNRSLNFFNAFTVTFLFFLQSPF